jgi:hypothetical protein
MTKLTSGALAAIAMLLLGPMPEANAQQRTQAGTLTCRLAPSVGLIVGSRQRMDCRFTTNRGNRVERYSGAVTRFGLDLGITAGGTMVWGVLSTGPGPRRGALAGTYVGASADIAFGLGVGANALVGGSNRSIVLQPLSVSGQVGVNLALGVAGLTLRYVR